MQRDNFTCQHCLSKDRTLVVHHKVYKIGRKYWEYDDNDLITLCERCHKCEHQSKDEFYETINDLKNSFERHGLSYGLLNALISDLDPDSLVVAEDFPKAVKDHFSLAAYGTQNYSDILILEILRVDDFSELKKYILKT